MSTTAVSEYIDMLFTRAHLALKDVDWWLEMRPSVDGGAEPKGFVRLRASVPLLSNDNGSTEIEHLATMRAIEENASVSTSVVERVVEYHLEEFMKRIEAAKRGELLGDN